MTVMTMKTKNKVLKKYYPNSEDSDLEFSQTDSYIQQKCQSIQINSR